MDHVKRIELTIWLLIARLLYQIAKKQIGSAYLEDEKQTLDDCAVNVTTMTSGY